MKLDSWKPFRTWGVVALVAVVAGVASLQAQQNFDNVEVKVFHVQGDVYLLLGAGGNVVAQVGDDGVFLVDTSFAPMAKKIDTALKGLTKKSIRYIANTHVHPDHIGGNEALAELGGTISGGNMVGQVGRSGIPATIVAHENLLLRMVDSEPPPAADALPASTYIESRKDLFFNGEAIQLIHPPNAHTDGDTMVFFRRSDVLVTGDIFSPAGYPFIDIERGGSINGLVDALNLILDVTVPAEKQEGGTYVVPGHGRVCDEADVVEYRDMVTIVRDRIENLIDRGMTLDQVKAARPTRDYDPIYNTPGAFVSADRFVESVYRSLSDK